MKSIYDPPFIVKKIFGQFYWETTNNKILLTFDDGPNAGTTEKILSKLSDLKIKALFFCAGNNIERQDGLAKEIISSGHVIGNHSFNHKVLTKLSKEELLSEINNFNKLLMEKYNYKVKYFRPPYGRINLRLRKILRETDMKCVMWNLLTYDYKKELKKVNFIINKYLSENSIIVLHDSNKTKDIVVDSIKFIAETADKKGFIFGEPHECLK